MKIIGTVRGSSNIQFNRNDQTKLLNFHFYGQENCNEFKNGKYIPIEHENRKILEQNSKNINSNFIMEVEADLTDTGKLINFRFVK